MRQEKKYFIGNWKMSKNFAQSLEYLDLFNKEFKKLKKDKRCVKLLEKSELILALPFTHLSSYLAMNKTNKLKLASQDVSEFDQGNYTGDINCDMLKSLEVTYSIVGHSERRIHHHETNLIVNQKANNLFNSQITPIICVGETLEDFEKQKTKEVLKEQLNESLKYLDLNNIIIAYEPIWAIGTGKSADNELIEEVVKFIKDQTQNKCPVLYGGSVNEKNITTLKNLNNVDGFLIGAASLRADQFLEIIKAYAS